MKIISAKKLSEALSKAQGVGLVEDRFTICNCEVVLRNLRPDEYEAVIEETKEQEDLAYLNAYQCAHVARSIVEINGTDLRDVRFIESEEDDPKKPGSTRTIKVELHTWIEQNILSTWSKEAIFTCYRKVGDVVAQAEEQARNGIVFRMPEETPEDKLRRIVGELREVEEEAPAELVTNVMLEAGYLRKTTVQEAEAADTRLSRLAADQAAEQASKAAEAPPPAPGTPSEPTPQELMARRAPMNRVVQAPPVVRAPPPEAVSPETLAAIPPPVSRSAKIAALEGDLVDDAIAMAGPPARPQPPQEVAELSHRTQPINAQAVAAILDQPPQGGINPRYQRPPR